MISDEVRDDVLVPRRIAMLLIALLSGAVLMSLEILGFRVIDRTFGSALRETSVVIAVFLGAMSIGYWLGGRSGDRHPRALSLSVPFTVAAITILIIPLLNDSVADRVFESALPRGLHSLLVTTILFAIPAGMLAAVYPIVVRVMVPDRAHSGSVAGTVSAVSTVGSIAGSLVTAFWLIDLFRSIDVTLRWLSGICLLLAVAAAVVDERIVAPGWLRTLQLRRSTVAIAVILFLGLVLTAAVQMLSAPPDGDEIRQGPDYGSRVLFERDSAYHHVVVRETNRRRLLYFGRTVQTLRDLDDPDAKGAAYTDYFHVPMLLDPDVDSVLFIGLGGGTGPLQFLRDYPGVTIDAVEVDPLVVEVARDFFEIRESDRLSIHTEDARAFLKRTDRVWDLIVVDAYSTNRYGATIPAHLTTREFFEICNERLTRDGMLLFHVMAPKEFRITRAISKTLYQVFPHQRVLGGTEILAMKQPGEVPPEDVAATLQQRAKERLPHREWLVERFDTVVPGRLDILGLPILTDDYAPVDTLIRKDGGI